MPEINNLLHKVLYNAMVFNSSSLIFLLNRINERDSVSISIEFCVEKVVISTQEKVLIDSRNLCDVYGIFLDEDEYKEGQLVETLILRGLKYEKGNLDTLCFVSYPRLSEHTECDSRDSK